MWVGQRSRHSTRAALQAPTGWGDGGRKDAAKKTPKRVVLERGFPAWDSESGQTITEWKRAYEVWYWSSSEISEREEAEQRLVAQQTAENQVRWEARSQAQAAQEKAAQERR